jgi:hypothetical protein
MAFIAAARGGGRDLYWTFPYRRSILVARRQLVLSRLRGLGSLEHEIP